MNQLEAGALLTLAAGYDRFMGADEITTPAWAIALADVPFEGARDAVVEHYKTQRRSVTVADIRQAVTSEAERTTPYRIAANVRAARGYGLIARDWPENKRLDRETENKLYAIRDEIKNDPNAWMTRREIPAWQKPPQEEA